MRKAQDDQNRKGKQEEVETVKHTEQVVGRNNLRFPHHPFDTATSRNAYRLHWIDQFHFRLYSSQCECDEGKFSIDINWT
jgi:hypothetical protein